MLFVSLFSCSAWTPRGARSASVSSIWICWASAGRTLVLWWVHSYAASVSRCIGTTSSLYFILWLMKGFPLSDPWLYLLGIVFQIMMSKTWFWMNITSVLSRGFGPKEIAILCLLCGLNIASVSIFWMFWMTSSWTVLVNETKFIVRSSFNSLSLGMGTRLHALTDFQDISGHDIL